MKNVLILIVILTFAVKGFSQNFESYSKTRYYQLTVPTFIRDTKDTTKELLAESQLLFTVLRTAFNGDKVIQFWKFPNRTDSTEKNKMIQQAAIYNYKNVNNTSSGNELSDLENQKIFIIKASDFIDNAIPYYSAGIRKGALDWSSGLVILPIKTRADPSFTFSKDISLGVSGGGKVRISHRNPTYLNVLFNVGISSVTIDSKSSKLTSPSEHAAYTTALGIVFENHSFQFGLFYGKDRLTKNDAETTDWIYNNKNWISIGIGYQLFKSNNNGQASKEGTQK